MHLLPITFINLVTTQAYLSIEKRFLKTWPKARGLRRPTRNLLSEFGEPNELTSKAWRAPEVFWLAAY